MIFALYTIDITQICPERHGKAFPAFGVLFVKTTSQTTFASSSGSTRTSSASLPYGSSASAERSCPYVHGGSLPSAITLPSVPPAYLFLFPRAGSLFQENPAQFRPKTSSRLHFSPVRDRFRKLLFPVLLPPSSSASVAFVRLLYHTFFACQDLF